MCLFNDKEELEMLRNYATVDRDVFYEELEERLFNSEVLESVWIQVKYDLMHYHKIMFALSNIEYAVMDAIAYSYDERYKKRLQEIRDELDINLQQLRNSVERRLLLV